MVKFENQVALNKMHRFAKKSCSNPKCVDKTQMLVFLNCENRALLDSRNHNSSYDFLASLPEQRYLSQIFFRNQRFVSSQQNLHTITEDDLFLQNKEEDKISFLLVKNKHLQKVLFGNAFVFSEQTAGKEKQVSSLTQGNRLLLSCTINNIKDLWTLKTAITFDKREQNPNITILGGVYKNLIIDHNQIKRLLHNNEKNPIDLHLNNSLKTPFLSFLRTASFYSKIIKLLRFKVQAEKTS